MGTAYWTNDNTVVINTTQVRLVHQGKTVTLEVNNTPNGSQCGLCGDYNMDKRTDVLSSKGCIMSSVKLAAHTYRSKSEQCRPISEKTLSQIRTEEERCVKFETKETKVKSVFNSELHDSRSIKKHSYIYKDDKICISQIPFVQCSINSMPREIERRLSTLSVFQRDVLQSYMLRELSVERSSRNSSINLLPSRLRWINLSLVNLAKFKCNGSHQFGQMIHYTQFG